MHLTRNHSSKDGYQIIGMKIVSCTRDSILLLFFKFFGIASGNDMISTGYKVIIPFVGELNDFRLSYISTQLIYIYIYISLYVIDLLLLYEHK